MGVGGRGGEGEEEEEVGGEEEEEEEKEGGYLSVLAIVHACPKMHAKFCF